ANNIGGGVYIQGAAPDADSCLAPGVDPTDWCVQGKYCVDQYNNPVPCRGILKEMNNNLFYNNTSCSSTSSRTDLHVLVGLGRYLSIVAGGSPHACSSGTTVTD